MIDADYVRLMARYNAWQNRQLTEALEGQPDEVLHEDRGAFFGSIFSTLNHILWGDAMWMSRLVPGVDAPSVGADGHTIFTPTFGVWSAERFRMDGAIRVWADGLNTIDLTGDLTWHSGMTGKTLSKPMSHCVVHMFNHQTHHRGQVHAMVTAAGLKAPVTDIVFMPEDS
ncbi:MAG: DinB family protein [Pseudomonadota bacterium]